MKRMIGWVLAGILALSCATAGAEEFDVSDMTLEQLYALDEVVHARITELEDEALSHEDDQSGLDQSDEIAAEKVAPSMLRSERDEYAGRVVCTVLYVEKVKEDKLQCFTDPEKSVYDAVATFTDTNELDGLEEGEAVMLTGEVEESSLFDFGDLYMTNCHILSVGEEAEEELQQLNAEQEEQAAQKEEQTKEEYAASCATVNYSEVERNPDSFEGQRITVSGTVVSVTEGWLGTTTLLVKDGKNIWDVEYKRPEGTSRILEKDKIIAYGECTGVDTSFSAILYGASSETIPAMEAVYIDIK